MKYRFLYLLLAISFVLLIQVESSDAQTYCNPLSLSYPLSQTRPSGPGLGDPTIVLYKDNYYLFASNAGGYWYSRDMLSWKFVSTANLPLVGHAPTATVIGDWIYFFTSLNDKIYRSNDPVSGKWEVYSSSLLLQIIDDFVVFADTDGKVYCYYGCSNHDGVMARELDPKNLLNPIGVPVVCKKTNPMRKGQKKLKETSVKDPTYTTRGSWMNKYNGKYYYQCTEPIESTIFGSVVYVSDTPLGPFKFADNNPFSYRPEGFARGAGNGSTFADKYGNWWHISTMNATTIHGAPTKLGLFPAGFDKDGNLFAKTDFGDYPTIIPNQKNSNVAKLDLEWSLLSDHITAKASSSIGIGPVGYAFDEDMGTYWSAQTGQKGEWLSVDLASVCTIHAVQVNFATHKLAGKGIDGVKANQYLIEYSVDNIIWKKLSDKTSNSEYQTNPYEALKIPVQAQFVRITNYHVPQGAFAISGFRIFGTGTDRKPKRVTEFRAVRDYRDPQIIKMSWKKQENTNGYNIRYGTDKDKLYHSHQTFKNTKLSIRCPDKSKVYWIEIDAFNENGVTPGKLQMVK